MSIVFIELAIVYISLYEFLSLSLGCKLHEGKTCALIFDHHCIHAGTVSGTYYMLNKYTF